MLLVLFLASYYRRIDPTFSRALWFIRISPISYRKLVINIVQLGFECLSLPIVFLKSLTRRIDFYLHDIEKLIAKLEIMFEKELLTAPEFINIIEPVLHSRMKRSLIWMFCRCCPIGVIDESEEIRKDQFYKEFRASQTVFWGEQIRDYSLLIGQESLRGVPYRHAKAAENVITKLANRLNREGIWYPHVQRTKNVSQETAILYCDYHPHRKISTVTTRDLEVHYGRTGVQIGGGCELRSAWKFNVMKPRLYYCQGGKDYFASRYIKRLAVCLMEAIPTTEMKRRTRPEDYLHVDDDEYITIWDYESFTTNLSELKYFLYYVARGLRDQAVYDIRLFDYTGKIVSVHPSDLLDQYNEDVNIQSSFSIHRIVDKYLYDEDASIQYSQQNSGMLGVAGNIGFSTACHGYMVLETVGPDKGVCVGDDAKGITKRPPEDILIPTVSELGSIHPEKFSTTEPLSEEPYRFVKRAFYRNPNGSLFKEELFNFPISAYIEGDVSYRDVFYESPFDLLKKTVSTIRSLLWSFQNDFELFDKDLDICLVFLRKTYFELKLPEKGFLPGYRLQVGEELITVHFACPSIEFHIYDPRVVDWLDYLLVSCHQEGYLIRPMAAKGYIPRVESGDILFTTQHPLWGALEDLELVETKPVLEYKTILDEESIREMKRFCSRWSPGEGPLVEVHCLDNIPPGLDELFVSSQNVAYWEPIGNYI